MATNHTKSTESTRDSEHSTVCRGITEDATICNGSARNGYHLCADCRSKLHVATIDQFHGPVNEDLRDLLLDVLDASGANVPAGLVFGLAAEYRTLRAIHDATTAIDRGLLNVGDNSYGLSYAKSVRRAIEAHWDGADPTRIVLVGCSSAKADTPQPARDLYESNYWAAKRAYASAVADSWRILSVEHVVLDPDREIAPYERHVDDLAGVPVQSDRVLPTGDEAATLLDVWACDVAEEATALVNNSVSSLDPAAVELEVLLGHSYEDPLRERGVFEHVQEHARTNVTVRWPFREVEGLDGIGDQMQWLTDSAAAVES